MLTSRLALEGRQPVESILSLRINLLGGFSVQRGGSVVPESAWQRRSAKTLTKLLAAHPRHSLHREQVLEILWPNASPHSALNSFGKALHAARRALEPGLPSREDSSYIRLSNEIVALETERVVVDSDRFEEIANRAFQLKTVSAYDAAVAAYTGDLLPEDRYRDWATERRHLLSDAYTRLLLASAEELEKCDAYDEAARRLVAALQHNPTREEVHRSLMRLYARMGVRSQALRQFQMCRDVLLRELDTSPEPETEALYHHILTNRGRPRVAVARAETHTSELDPSRDRTSATFVGRSAELRVLLESLGHAEKGSGGTIVLSGEAGIGKTRLVAEMATEAGRQGATLMWGAGSMHANQLPYGRLLVALDRYIASRPRARRRQLARAYPGLTHVIPSLGLPPPSGAPGADQFGLLIAFVRLLAELGERETLVLVLEDLHGAHPSNVDFVEYVAHLAGQRRWLIVSTFRDVAVGPGSALQRMVEATTRAGVGIHLELEPLRQAECDELVQALLPKGDVDDVLLDHVYELSLGNPLFVKELVCEMQERGDVILIDGCWHWASPSDRVPKRVRALIETSMPDVEKSTRRVLALAATAGMEVTLAELRTGAAALRPPVSDAALFDALDHALRIRILEERDEVYVFRHPLVRATLREDLASHRRLEFEVALRSVVDGRTTR
jgi:DNA-binding SARP family transcriptional activator